MSFRRNAIEANYWRKRLEHYPELLQRVALPDYVFQSDRTLRFFLNEGCFQTSKESQIEDALKFMSEQQQFALYELLSKVFNEQERIGTIWTTLDSRFGKGNAHSHE